MTTNTRTQNTGKEIALFASGDLRLSANQQCWAAQDAMEGRLAEVLAGLGYTVRRAHPYKPEEKHGFLASQREGMDAFATIDPDMPVIVAEAVWQYSHHVLAGLTSHKGPILTVANWSGQWPGLVGLLNLNGSLTKAGVTYASLWSETFDDGFFLSGLREWLETGSIGHDTSHVTPFDAKTIPAGLKALAADIAADFRRNKVILGIFDEGCMGMYNAIIPDELLMPLGIFKERLSQSALYYATTQVPIEEGRAVYEDLLAKGMTFHLGSDPKTELTEAQVIDQCRMYVAAVRIAEEFGCEAIGIQYQQGLKDLLPASDLVEGILNDDGRPDVRDRHGKIIRRGRAIVHFNEVDECAGLDGLMTNRLHRALGQPVENTLHDLRWGEHYPAGSNDGAASTDGSASSPEGDPNGNGGGDFVWVFEISGAVPPSHNQGGWAGSDSLRQPAMFFPAGGGTLRGIARPGEIVWSRIFVENNALHMDIGRGQAVALPTEETDRRWKSTSEQWPMMHAVLTGVSRDQMMARHKANHIQVVYANSPEDADHAALAKAALAQELGISVNLCGITQGQLG